MAEELEHSAHVVQQGEDINEEIVERKELSKDDTDGPEQEEETSSVHFRPRHETSGTHEDQVDHTTPPFPSNVHTPPQTFSCWQEVVESSEVEDFINGGSTCLMILWPMS